MARPGMTLPSTCAPHLSASGGTRSVRYLTFHGKFTSGMRPVRGSRCDGSAQLGRTPAPRSRLGVDPSTGSAVQLVGDLRDLAALVAGTLELIRGRAARAVTARDG